MLAHYEPPHQELRHLQIKLFSSLVPKELITYAKYKDICGKDLDLCGWIMSLYTIRECFI